MRTLLARLLLIIFLLDTTPAQEIMKLPELWVHFEQHRKVDGSGPIQFLVTHYLTDDGNSQDNEQEQQLPFHQHHSNLLPVHSTIPPTAVVLQPTETLAKAEFPRQFYSLPEEYLVKPWQPPRC